MAIDPDVQVEVDRLDARIALLETPALEPVGRPDFDPSNFSAAAVNATVDALYRDYRGGRIVIDGYGQDLHQEAPITVRPGIELCGVGQPSVSEPVRTRLVAGFSGPHFIQDPRTHTGKPRAWGQASIHHFTVANPQDRPAVRVLDVAGGNHSHTHDLAQQGGNYEYGVNMIDLRGKSDGQYSHYTRINIYGATYPLYVDRPCPDVNFTGCMFYGRNKGGTTGPEHGSRLYVGSNAIEFDGCRSQFTDIGWELDAAHIVIRGGAQEMYVGWSEDPAEAVFKLGPKARDVVVAYHSVANLASSRNLLVAAPSVRYASFDRLPGVRPGHVDDDHKAWFTFISAKSA